jgi:hypothetical protein
VSRQEFTAFDESLPGNGQLYLFRIFVNVLLADALLACFLYLFLVFLIGTGGAGVVVGEVGARLVVVQVVTIVTIEVAVLAISVIDAIVG